MSKPLFHKVFFKTGRQIGRRVTAKATAFSELPRYTATIRAYTSLTRPLLDTEKSNHVKHEFFRILGPTVNLFWRKLKHTFNSLF